MTFICFRSLKSKGETEDEAVIFALEHAQKHLEQLRYSSCMPILCTIPKFVIFGILYEMTSISPMPNAYLYFILVSKMFQMSPSLSHHVIKDSGASVLGNALQGLTRMRSLR